MKTTNIDYSKIKDFDQLLDAEYGKIGTPKRSEFHRKAQLFIIAEMLKAERKNANLTQEELAEKIGTKKSYISRIEKAKADLQVSTLFKIFEEGLGLKITLNVSPI